ncbi:MAG: hypothetical protein WB499_01100, partial [Pseudolabrys sp.]
RHVTQFCGETWTEWYDIHRRSSLAFLFSRVSRKSKSLARKQAMPRKRTVDALTAQNRWAKGGQLRFSDEVCFPVAFVG